MFESIEKCVFGTSTTPSDGIPVETRPLPGGWTENDLDLSPWIVTIRWEVELRAGRARATPPVDKFDINGIRPCSIEADTWAIYVVYPEYETPEGIPFMIKDMWPFPIKDAPKKLINRVAKELERQLVEMNLLDKETQP